MDRIHVCFLNILQHGLQGKALEEPCNLTADEWTQLMQMAQCHHVLPLVFEAVHGLSEMKDAPFLPSIKQQIRQQVMLQTRRTAAFLQLQQRLQEAGIRPLVVKGIICRELYPKPDHRVSGDEDVWILPEQMTLCHQVLTRCGMTTTVPEELHSDTYEIPYRQNAGPLYIELHRYLFPPESEAYGDLNRFFADSRDRARAVSVQGATIYTLEHTDHLFYLICHAFKHFLHSGFGIRQVCDMVMYANAFGSQIQWQQLLDNCRVVHCDLFAAALFRVGEKYLGFDPVRACYPECWHGIAVDEAALLEDILGSGVYGNSSRSRLHSSSITLDAVSSRKSAKKEGNPILISLFPSAKQLESRYPYLKKHPYLLPAAWASRMGSFLKESSQSHGSDAGEALKLGNQRVALLKQYGILK